MKRGRIAAFSLAFVLIATVIGVAAATPSANHMIARQVIGSGGAMTAGGSVTIHSTLGQTAIGPGASPSHSIGPGALPIHSIGAGYWAAVSSPTRENALFLPAIINN